MQTRSVGAGEWRPGRGRSTRTLGHIGMFHTCVDVTDLTCELGDLVRVEINPLLMKGLPVSLNRFTLEGDDRDVAKPDRALQYVPVFVLDEDRSVAMEKLAKIEELERQLPGLHCGSCGAPSCHAFAEDVVLGRADRSDCIFKVRERTEYMAGTDDADEYLPAPFRQKKGRSGGDPSAEGDFDQEVHV